MSYPKIFLKSRRDQRILEGHLWAFSNEIDQIENAPDPGTLVDIYSHRKKFLGRGFYNPHSLISARILTRLDEAIGPEFFSKKIEAAKRFRGQIYPREKSYRLIFGESDFLPGLVIDRFENCFVIQSYCLGMDLLMPMVIQGIQEHFQPDLLIKRNDSPIRHLENLKDETEILKGQIQNSLKISQQFDSNPLQFLVDPLHGQKTGFFFDQKENRAQMSRFARGKSVLDCFAYTGGFGLYAAKSGASEVVCVESSKAACQLLEENFKINNEKCSMMQEDIFETLSRFQKENRKFDIMVLDPPALAKSQKNFFGALRKYQKLNEMALALLNQDGILISCSCSHHLKRTDFLRMINQASITQDREVRLLEMRGQAPDHPILPSMPETDYLKCAVIKVT